MTIFFYVYAILRLCLFQVSGVLFCAGNDLLVMAVMCSIEFRLSKPRVWLKLRRNGS